MALFFVLCLAAAASLSSAHPASESFNKLVNKAADDLADVVKETSDTVHQVVEKNIAVAGFVGNTAVNVAVTGGEAALDFLSSIDAEKVLNDTEEAVIDQKTALIKGAFDAKRKAVKIIEKAVQDHKDTVKDIVLGSVGGISVALNTTGNGIVSAKEIVVNYTSDVDLSSAQAAIGNAINGTIAAVENAGSALTEAIVNAKLGLHNATQNINTNAITNAVNVTVTATGNFVDNWGITSAINGLVETFSAIPMKINAILQGSPSEAASTTAAPTAATTAAPSAKIGIAAADTEEDPVSEYEDY